MTSNSGILIANVQYRRSKKNKEAHSTFHKVLRQAQSHDNSNVPSSLLVCFTLEISQTIRLHNYTKNC